MKARQAIASASYGPEQLQALGRAFDDAWHQIAPTVSKRPRAVEAARLKLADVILGLARKGNLDAQWLADTAVQVMGSGTPTAPP
jgi:hypothetical protein